MITSVASVSNMILIQDWDSLLHGVFQSWQEMDCNAFFDFLWANRLSLKTILGVGVGRKRMAPSTTLLPQWIYCQFVFPHLSDPKLLWIRFGKKWQMLCRSVGSMHHLNMSAYRHVPDILAHSAFQRGWYSTVPPTPTCYLYPEPGTESLPHHVVTGVCVERLAGHDRNPFKHIPGTGLTHLTFATICNHQYCCCIKAILQGHLCWCAIWPSVFP